MARQGDDVAADDVHELAVFGPSGEPETPTLVLFRNGEEMSRVADTELRYERPPPGTYRVEVRIPIARPFLGTRFVTAIYSNRLRLTN